MFSLAIFRGYERAHTTEHTEESAPNASLVWWTPGLIEHIARFLPTNDISCGIRLVNRATAALFRSPEHYRVRLSEPCPVDAFKLNWDAPGSVRFLTHEKRQKLVSLTAATGNLANLEVAMQASQCALTHTMLKAAAAAGQLDACKWLRELGCPWSDDSLLAAAHSGNADLCAWMLAHGCPWSDHAVLEALRGGHIGLSSWLLQQRPPRRPKNTYKLALVDMLSAAADGLELPVFLPLLAEWQQRPPAPDIPLRPLRVPARGALLAAAAASPTPDWQAKVTWLEAELDCPPTPDAIKKAAKRPDGAQRVAWLLLRGYPLEDNWKWLLEGVPDRDVRSAIVQILLHRIGGVRDISPVVAHYAVSIAARDGDLALLRSLHAAGHFPERQVSDIAQAAALCGHLAVLAWLLGELGYRGDRYTCRLLGTAAQAGHVEVVTWLMDQHGLAPSCSDMLEAVVGGCEAAMELLLGRGCAMAIKELCSVAALTGDRATLRWLQQQVAAGKAAGAGGSGPGAQRGGLLLKRSTHDYAPWCCCWPRELLCCECCWRWWSWRRRVIA